MAPNKDIDPALVPRRNPQLAATQQMGIPPAAAKLSQPPQAMLQRNPQLAATSGVAGAVPPAAAKITPAPPVRRFNSGWPGVQGPAMPPSAQRPGVAAPIMGAAATAPVAAPTRPTPTLATPPVAQPPAAAAPVASALTRPPAPAVASVGGRQLPGAPNMGADGSIVYDQAFADRNVKLMDQYQRQNVVQTVVPGAGVAQSMATGGNMQAGSLTRPPRQGFTNADRAAQLDGLDRLGRSNADTKVREALGRAAGRGDAQATATFAGASRALASPPLEPMTRSMANADAAASNDAARLGMEQDAARMGAEQQGIQTQQQQIQLKQAQQMQALSEQLMQGTPEQKQAAAASLAALQGTKPGQPIKVKRQVPTGQVDALGVPVMGEEEVLYNPQNGQWMAPPPAGGGAGQPPAQAIDYLKQNDTPQTRAAFQAKYGVDPATILG